MSSDGALAIHGGPKAVTSEPGDVFDWPVVTDEDEAAVLEVLRRGAMSGTDVTKQFEVEFADWIGMQYALAYNNGTASLRAAMWACEVGLGDEIICPSLTFWASCTQALTLGAAVHFADVEADSIDLDPSDIERRIGPRTKALMVVHYSGYPADMDAILAVAEKHDLKVIEDVSHAQGALYKGRKCGTFGHVAAMSLMSGKSLAIGEGGMLVTDDRTIYERCIAYGHYERTGAATMYNPPTQPLSDPELSKYSGLAMGGFKHRIHQLSSAVGRVQLRHYDERMAEIDRAMNAFCDRIDEAPGIIGHRPPKDSGRTNGGWYNPFALYDAAELGGLPVARFIEALNAEGVPSGPINFPLHLHPLFHDADLFWEGRPTMIAHTDRDVRQGPGTLPRAEAVPDRTLRIPWFKKHRPELIEETAGAFRKVAEHADELRA
jgi:dTDP-4-amino-4,6-dideoxygalactose transaminase